MAENTYKTHLEKILKQDERLLDDDKEIKGNLLKEFVNQLDEKLIGLLLDDDKSREKFFLRIKDAYVFKASDFKFFIDENAIDNSFTQYANQIGLASNGKFLSEFSDVVINFPYKDCVLEGGQSSEEGLDCYFEYDSKTGEYQEKYNKRKETFYNEIIAKEEIDRLEEPKAFKNIKEISSVGRKTLTGFNRNSEGVITDNLIIKGNNLLTLYSLKKEFKGLVKLIYIDPPYYFNKEVAEDSFKYNSNFRLSTWLTFMQNRLEEAKFLLKKDGFIAVQIKTDGYAHLKLLMDQIFDKNNMVNSISVKMSESSGVKMAHVTKRLPNIFEHILLYRVNVNTKIKPIKIAKENEEDDSKLEKYLKYYSKIIENKEDAVENWNILSLDEYFKKNNLKEPSDNYKEFKIQNSDRMVYRTNNKAFDKLKIKKKLAKVISTTGIEYIWWEGKQMLFLEDYISEYICDLWTDISTINLNKEGGVHLPNGKKPEKLLARIIELTTEKNDIVLDYHLGSGTTCAVAHKMGRQYIGAEQLDYGINDSLIRLENVVKGDSSGISEQYGWKGGGEFVYMELAKNNEKAKDEIKACDNLEEILSLVKDFEQKYFLHYNVNFKEFIQQTVQEENFQKLKLGKQKEMFCRLLDLNQLYINASEMEDNRYDLKEKDIELTKDFYQIKE